MFGKNFVSQKKCNYINQLKNYAKQKRNNLVTLLIRFDQYKIIQ